MPKKIRLHNLRISFIWVETILDLISDRVPKSAPLSFLGRPTTYASQYNKIVKGNKVSGDLKLPWPDEGVHYFWKYYLEGCTPGSMSGKEAWKAIVPLRGKVPAKVEAPWLPGRFFMEALFYPHSLALLVTAICYSELRLEEAVELAFKVRSTGRFRVKWEGAKSTESLSLNIFAEEGLNILREFALGEGANPGKRSVLPFTVVTIVRGTGVDPSKTAPEEGNVHRALEALTTWRPSWRHDKLPPFSQVSLQIRTAPLSHILYGNKRGRAVWFPSSFTQEEKTPHTLSCYHRNLIFASIQVESLSGLVSVTAKQIRDGISLPVAHCECARRAVGILGRLYGGADSTYRSWSPRIQIEQNNLVADINYVRSFFNMPALD